jgi:hypothetical protein
VRWAKHVARLTDEECVLSFIRGILKGSDHLVDLGVEGGISAVGLEEVCGLGSCDCEQGQSQAVMNAGLNPRLCIGSDIF